MLCSESFCLCRCFLRQRFAKQNLFYINVTSVWDAISYSEVHRKLHHFFSKQNVGLFITFVSAVMVFIVVFFSNLSTTRQLISTSPWHAVDSSNLLHVFIFCCILTHIFPSYCISIPMQALTLQPTTNLPLSTDFHVSFQRSTKRIRLPISYRLARWYRLRSTFQKHRHQKSLIKLNCEPD